VALFFVGGGLGLGIGLCCSVLRRNKLLRACFAGDVSTIGGLFGFVNII
jgi:hypothetical protein